MTEPPHEWLDRLYTAVGISDERHPRSRMAAALETLPGREREIVTLRFREGLSYARIGAALDISATSANRITLKSVRRLRHPRRWQEKQTPDELIAAVLQEMERERSAPR